jgi:hypothetical protein
MDIPTFAKKRSLLQSSDIPEHTWQVVGRDDSLGFSLKRNRLSLPGDGHS